MPLLGGPTGAHGERLSVDGSLAGRASGTVEPVETDSDGRSPALAAAARRRSSAWACSRSSWRPARRRSPDALQRAFEQLGHLLAELLVSNSRLHRPLRVGPAPAGDDAAGRDAAPRCCPPLTFGTHRVVISGLLAPAYEVGGDAFDYALNGNIAHVAVFDAVGHGLHVEPARQPRGVLLPQHPAGRPATCADRGAAIDQALARRCSAASASSRRCSASSTSTPGVFRWVNAGAPRRDAAARRPGGEGARPASPRLPLGHERADRRRRSYHVSSESLQPGDRLLLRHRRRRRGARPRTASSSGATGLAEFAAKELASGPADAGGRCGGCRQAILRHQTGQLQDDATTVFVEWLTGVGQQMQPDEL